jgi:hypothetical protein
LIDYTKYRNGSAVAFVDLPSEPEELAQAERADMAADHAHGSSAERLKAREMPDPDERSRLYDAMRAHAGADGAEDAPTGRLDRAERQSYSDEVPRFLDMWAEHERRWPARPRIAADSSADSPEPHMATVEAIGRIREAERGLSSDAQAIEQENKYGGWLEGFKHRLKDEDRLKEKIADKVGAELRMTSAEALREVGDAIRYTYCFQPVNYTKGYYDIKERWEGRGCEMYYSKNYWTDPEYKGINTRWVTPEGQRFEVQIHTPDSFHAKHHLTHLAYERIRDPETKDEERGELEVFQRAVSAWIDIPERAANIPDYKKEGF